MKNKLLTLLTVTMLAGSIFVGCGGNETGADANNGSGTNVEVNEETNKDNDDVAAKIDPNIEYTETAIAFLVANDADVDKSMVDGTEVPDITEDVAENSVEYKVTFKTEVNLYAKDKSIIGYLKPNVEVAFAEIKDGWAIVGSTDYTEKYFLSISEIESVIEIIEESYPDASEEDDTVEDAGMSEKAEAYFDKIRARIAEYNEDMVELQDSGYKILEETTSPENMEYITTFTHEFDNEEHYATIIDVIRQLGFNQFKSKYYLEYVSETETSVEYKLYLAE